MDTRTKHNLLVTIIGITLFVALMNLSAVLRFAGNIIRLILPVIVGGILALFVSVPMNGVEKRLTLLFRKAKKQPSQKQLHVISFVITVICVLLVLILVLTLIVPEIVRSSQSLYIQIRASIPRWNEYLNEHDMNIQWVENLIADIDLDMVMQNISDGIGALLVNIVDVLSSTVNIVVTSAFALIICIYISLGKERLCRHARRLVRAYLKPIWAENVLHFCNVLITMKTSTRILLAGVGIVSVGLIAYELLKTQEEEVLTSCKGEEKNIQVPSIPVTASTQVFVERIKNKTMEPGTTKKTEQADNPTDLSAEEENMAAVETKQDAFISDQKEAIATEGDTSITHDISENSSETESRENDS